MNTRTEQIKNDKNGIFRIRSNLPSHFNAAIIKGFFTHRDDADVKRSHLFNGRYENIYLNETQIPELTQLLNLACTHASQILGQSKIQAGCWFNHMPRGSITLPHRHDDNDELLSAVYYLEAPENSGDLIIHAPGANISITPKTGMFIFFKPDVVHEVSENKSQLSRLSIGINFGAQSSVKTD